MSIAEMQNLVWVAQSAEFLVEGAIIFQPIESFSPWFQPLTLAYCFCGQRYRVFGRTDPLTRGDTETFQNRFFF